MVEGQRPFNRRAEIYLRARAVLPYVALERDSELLEEFEAIPYGYAADQTSYQIARKEDIKKELGYSPDDVDGFCLLWAVPIASRTLASLPQADHGGADWYETWRQE